MKSREIEMCRYKLNSETYQFRRIFALNFVTLWTLLPKFEPFSSLDQEILVTFLAKLNK